MSEAESKVLEFEKRLNDVESHGAFKSVDRVKTHVNYSVKHGAKWKWVPEDYYERSMLERSNILGCEMNQMCKSLIMENTACGHSDISDRTNSRYYCIVVQYTAKVNNMSLNKLIKGLRPPDMQLSNNQINLQLADGKISRRLTGFDSGAVCPFGLLTDIPIIMCSNVMQSLNVPLIWMGGGDVKLKLGVNMKDFIMAHDPIIGNITEERDLSEEHASLLSSTYAITGETEKNETETIKSTSSVQEIKEKSKKSKKDKEKKQSTTTSVSDIFNPNAMDLRVGLIVNAYEHPDSEKLYVEEIDIGEKDGPRTICSGLRAFYDTAEMLMNRKVIICANLKARPMGGIKSNGMVVCCSDKDHKTVTLIDPPVEAEIGDRVIISDFDIIDPFSSAQVVKRKILEQSMPEWKTNEDYIACYKDKPFVLLKDTSITIKGSMANSIVG